MSQGIAMTSTALKCVAAFALLWCFGATAKEAALTDAAITQRLIDASIAGYSGNCPCPYNTASNGSRCGKRSAYSRPGGESPLCYAADVDQDMISGYRRQQGR